ncbi:sortase domain-bontaining protein [Pseudactinotalea sp. Z1748]|uniref:class F sortase n=1 Tax=Pseudactinotalea sp. Z1748 TaxID=3413027 RepID=UPI003C7ECF5D
MFRTKALSLVILLLAGILGGCATPVAQPPSRSAPTDAAAAQPEPSAISPEAHEQGRTEATAPESQAVPGEFESPAVEVAVRTARLEAAGPEARTPPVRLEYAERDITLDIDPVGVAADGQMEIPDDANRAGWYRFGPGLGDGNGSIVVAAHNGSFTTGVGPFHYLRQAQPGDSIDLIGPDGTEVTYDVLTVTSEAKETIDLADHFRRDGQPRLVLITCGGQWDEARGSYTDNIVVTASLRQG